MKSFDVGKKEWVGEKPINISIEDQKFASVHLKMRWEWNQKVAIQNCGLWRSTVRKLRAPLLQPSHPLLRDTQAFTKYINNDWQCTQTAGSNGGNQEIYEKAESLVHYTNIATIIDTTHSDIIT